MVSRFHGFCLLLCCWVSNVEQATYSLTLSVGFCRFRCISRNFRKRENQSVCFIFSIELFVRVLKLGASDTGFSFSSSLYAFSGKRAISILETNTKEGLLHIDKSS